MSFARGWRGSDCDTRNREGRWRGGRFRWKTRRVDLALGTGWNERRIPKVDSEGAVASGERPVGGIGSQHLLLLPLDQRQGAYSDRQLPEPGELRGIDTELAGGCGGPDQSGAQHGKPEKKCR